MNEKREPVIPTTNLEEVTKQLKQKFLNQINSMRDFSAFYREFLFKINISLKSLQEGKANFKENREKLNSEAGVIIANHPGVFDTVAILSLLSRDDILFMADEVNHVKGTKIENNFIKTPHGLSTIKEAFDRVRKHIEQGGIFLIFPTAGSESYGGDFKFKSGFRNMLTDGTLKKDTMIYSFNIQGAILQIPDKETEEYKNKRLLYFAQQVIPNSQKNITAPAPLEIILDERYTTAEEWIHVLETNPKDKDVALSSYYLNLFK